MRQLDIFRAAMLFTPEPWHPPARNDSVDRTILLAILKQGTAGADAVALAYIAELEIELAHERAVHSCTAEVRSEWAARALAAEARLPKPPKP